MAALLFTAPLAAAADACMVGENFNDGAVDAMWSLTQSGNQQVAEQNGRLEFPGTGGTDDPLSVAGVVGTGWQLNLDADFLMSANGHVTLSNPGSEGIIGTVVVLTSTPDGLMDGAFDDAVMYFHGWAFGELVEGIEVFQGGESIYDDYEGGDTGTGETYIGYDTLNDTFVVDGFIGFPDPWSWSGLGALLGNKTTVSVMAVRAGSYGSNSGSNLWSDDWCLHFGKLTGSLVGACCVAEDCVETLERSCAGTWHGAGSACSTLTCDADEPTGACCVGTACQTLTVAACAAAGGSYHGDDVLCAATPCGGGAGCPLGWQEDCVGICFPNVVFDEWVGDGFCDDGAWVPYASGYDASPPGVAIWLNCDEFKCDDGDCSGCPLCLGDVNGDGMVQAADVVDLLDEWGTSDGNSDIDGSGSVGVHDLLIVLMQWGSCA